MPLSLVERLDQALAAGEAPLPAYRDTIRASRQRLARMVSR